MVSTMGKLPQPRVNGMMPGVEGHWSIKYGRNVGLITVMACFGVTGISGKRNNEFF